MSSYGDKKYHMTSKKIPHEVTFMRYFYYKLITGVEPVTSSLPMRCATSCAISAYKQNDFNKGHLHCQEHSPLQLHYLSSDSLQCIVDRLRNFIHHLCNCTVIIPLHIECQNVRLKRTARFSNLLHHIIHMFFIQDD